MTSAATGELLAALLPGRLRADRAGGRRPRLGRGRRRLRSRLPAAPCAPPRPAPATRSCGADLAKRPLIEVDLHMHTDHSPRLRDAGRGAAADGARPRPRGDRDHRPQRGLGGARGGRDRRGDGRPQGDRRRGGEDRRAGRGDRPLPQGEDPERADDGGNDRRDPRAGGPRLRARTRSTASTRCPTTSTCSTSSRRSTCSRSSTRAWR